MHILNCEYCNYTCTKKFLWEQHLITKKHINNTIKFSVNNNKTQIEKDNLNNELKCDICNKTYKSRSGLWRHNKICKKIKTNYSQELAEYLNKNDEDVYEENKELKILMKKMLEGLNEDAKIKDHMVNQLKEQNKIILDMVPRIGNNQFNINVFLNEQCRDAINMSEFLETLQIQLKDLIYTKDNGLIEGISTVFVNGLKQLDTFKRPIHCTDMKRETLYIKDNNEWERENGKECLRNAINDVASKQRIAINEWEKNNPNWDKTVKGKEEYIKIVKTVMTDISDEHNKIIKNIAKETIINK
jgi:hypothetical protein